MVSNETGIVAGAPAWVSWMGLGLGALGVAVGIVTLPTALQMFFGRPKIAFGFSDHHEADLYMLRCHVSNSPIESKALRRLGVIRSSVCIGADVKLVEHGTNRIIIPLLRMRLATDKETGLQVDLPFSIAPARCNVIGHIPGNGTFVAPQDGGDQAIQLNDGVYVLKIDIETSHQTKSSAIQYIVVSSPNRPYWLPSVP
jgi:hypothetical protein